MSIITLLSEDLINKIAAGEVVQGPTEALKELIENSLDSNATSIEIEIEGGGFSKIKVQDNGKGMSYDDLLLCIKRHATSKIKISRDLEEIKTLGFRGEALSSISSISKMHIVTSIDGFGHEAYFEKGDLIEQNKKARPMGTTIVVMDLFYNVPVRKTFLKHQHHESKIERLVSAYSLCYLDVRFKLSFDKKECLFTPVLSNASLKEKLLDRASLFLSDELIAHSHFLHAKQGPFQVYGLIAKPHLATKTKKMQLFFINDRLVESKQLEACVKSAYSTSIDEHARPPFCLFVHAPPSYIDINIHPQKKVVRFTDISLFAFLKSRIQKVLHEPMELSSSFTPFHSNAGCSFELKNIPFSNEIVEPELKFKSKVRILSRGAKIAFCQTNSDALLIVNLKGVVEKQIEEQLAQNIEKKVLLIPKKLYLELWQITFIEKHLEMLSQYGFEAERLGPKVAILKAYPFFIKEEDVEEIFFHLIESLKENTQKTMFEQKKILKTLIGTIHLGQFSNGALEKMIEQFQSCATHSPFGKPLFFTIDEQAGLKLIEKGIA